MSKCIEPLVFFFIEIAPMLLPIPLNYYYTLHNGFVIFRIVLNGSHRVNLTSILTVLTSKRRRRNDK